jgi:hypothetical protein
MALLAVLTSLLAQQAVAAQEELPLAVGSEEPHTHIFPTVSKAAQRVDTGTSGPALVYNGGPVMTKANTYAIFWVPPKLQTGAATSMSSHYQQVQTALLSEYPGHGIDNNNTQYYMKEGFGWLWIQNSGGLAGSYVDTSPYPPSECSDPATPGNCITDAQIQVEIQNVMGKKKWSGGLNNMFLLFTSSGEGSMNPYGDLAYVEMCAYHGYFFSGSTPIIYGDIPFGDPNICQVPGTPSPNGDPAADTAATAVSHELTEAITDPELNAWTTSSGEEIGDLCAYVYGPNTWGSTANQDWAISLFGIFTPTPAYFELQEEYDNHVGGCVQLGP